VRSRIRARATQGRGKRPPSRQQARPRPQPPSYIQATHSGRDTQLVSRTFCRTNKQHEKIKLSLADSSRTRAHAHIRYVRICLLNSNRRNGEGKRIVSCQQAAAAGRDSHRHSRGVFLCGRIFARKKKKEKTQTEVSALTIEELPVTLNGLSFCRVCHLSLLV